MVNLTRRRLLGGAALGTLGVAACTTTRADAPYSGAVAFRHGVASGDPLSDRIVLWTRVTPLDGAGTIPVRYRIAAEASPDVTAAEGLVTASAARDFCVKVDVGGLAPATRYRYQFTALTAAGEVASPEGRTRTTAASGTASVKLGVVSCSNWQFGLFNAYAALATERDLDAIVHLGDYLYEYGTTGYGDPEVIAAGRAHEPAGEIVTLADYRARHAQYKTDPDLQAAHAAAPWICTWDDHESANDSYRTGAENHAEDGSEGSWSDRKQAALQAYFDWMPLRDPVGGISSAAWRSFSFGDVASLHAIETRLTGRSPNLDWGAALTGLTEPAAIMAKAGETMQAAADPARTMMGAEQEAWLAGELSGATASGKAWQVLANQVIMARVKLPNLPAVMTPEQIAAQELDLVKLMIGFSALGLPFNLDAWDGFPAARERLYASAAAAQARLVTLTGDTHTAWANTLHDAKGQRRGVEFGCTSITSPGIGQYVKDLPDLGNLFSEANTEVDWHDPYGHGYTIVTLTADKVRADFRKVDTIAAPSRAVRTVASFETVAEAGGASALRAV